MTFMVDKASRAAAAAERLAHNLAHRTESADRKLSIKEHYHRESNALSLDTVLAGLNSATLASAGQLVGQQIRGYRGSVLHINHQLGAERLNQLYLGGSRWSLFRQTTDALRQWFSQF
jgi:ABC-type branched-subunit amino acid transport system ATPase component